MKTIKIALDWTPNTIHAGIFLAKAKGIYQDYGVQVELISPSQDAYNKTPARRVAERSVHLGIAPSESVLSYRTSRNPVPIKAVAAILQKDTSAIVTLHSSGIERPKDLDRKIYASYQARFEDKIIQAMIINDGGKGNLDIEYPTKLGIWDTIITGNADATWVFMPWEGIQAKLKTIELNVFRLENYGIPYGYSPVFVAHEDTINAQPDLLRDFLLATEQGYQLIGDNIDRATQTLCDMIDTPDFKSPTFIKQSLQELEPAFLTTKGNWGKMSLKKWTTFIEWIGQQELIEPSFLEQPEFVQNLFTNRLLEKA